jgi:hypothetical protein
MELITLKNELKELANKIRATRKSFKNEQRNESLHFKNLNIDFITKLPGTNDWYKDDQKIWTFESDLYKLKKLFRHKHIAYCLLKGRVYEQIEKPSENNPPNWTIIKGVLDAYRAS